MGRMRRVHRGIRWLALALLLIVLGFILYAFARQRPQDLPWTPLDLNQPIGLFTGRKIVALTKRPDECRALLARAGVGFDRADPFGEGQCLVDDGLKLGAGSRTIMLQPDNPKMACPVAAGLALWEWHVVQPAARRIFGQRVDVVDQLGVWNCRRIAGSTSMSQHSTADAIDIAGFRLADGTKITVLDDWNEGGKKAAFLREVRDGTCDLFSVVLSPDYNAAHADHLHIDQTDRGAFGRRSCR